MFQLLLKGCTIEALIVLTITKQRWMRFSCCWKDVRLKHNFLGIPQAQILVSVVVERMYDWSFVISAGKKEKKSFSCCWKDVRLKLQRATRSSFPISFSCCWKDVRLKPNLVMLIRPLHSVSVVVERMYDWSRLAPYYMYRSHCWFQLLLKGCTIEARITWFFLMPIPVSVVVERMYDWSTKAFALAFPFFSFSCCWKDVRLKLRGGFRIWGSTGTFQLLLKGCTIEALVGANEMRGHVRFSCCWKDVRLKPDSYAGRICRQGVSVVVERMYDWSSETNWLKTNDFWQLVSDLFFENGRSAQKVPLFSKIWGDLGDCLTVFDSCSNI